MQSIAARIRLRIAAWIAPASGSYPAAPSGSTSSATSEPELLDDPLDRSGDGDLKHNVGYVSRWGLVEFGVQCSRCGEQAAAPHAFERARLVRLPTGGVGEIIDCPSCGTKLLACPVTEKMEHKDTDPATVANHSRFAREPHRDSPLSSAEAHSHRNRLKVSDMGRNDSLAYAMQQATAETTTSISP